MTNRTKTCCAAVTLPGSNFAGESSLFDSELDDKSEISFNNEEVQDHTPGKLIFGIKMNKRLLTCIGSVSTEIYFQIPICSLFPNSSLGTHILKAPLYSQLLCGILTYLGKGTRSISDDLKLELQG